MKRIALLVSVLFLAACGGNGSSSPDLPRTDLDTDLVTGDLGPDRTRHPDDVTPDGMPDDGGLPDLVAGDVPDLPGDAVDGLEPPDLPDLDLLADEETVPATPFAIAFVTPEDAATVTGSVRVTVAPVDELLLDTLVVSLNGQPIFADTKAPTSFVLDTRAHQASVLELTVAATKGTESASDAVTVAVENPPFRFKHVSASALVVANGTALELLVNGGKSGLDLTADFSAVDSAYVVGNETVNEIGAGKYKVLYTLSGENTRPDGLYPVTLTLTDGVVVESYDHLLLTLENVPVPPIRILGGIFVPGAAPDSDPTWDHPEAALGGNEFIITGGSAKVDVDFTGHPFPGDIIGMVVRVEGYGGYYQVPLSGSAGNEELLVLMRAYVEGEDPPSSLPLRLALRDVTGRLSPYADHPLVVESVGSGDVQVSVSWDTATDVDLHVIEPTGYELWYGDKSSPSGGILDLDSNPACSIDGVNNENVFWPPGMAPVGTYVVRVDFYSDCSNCDGLCGANYTVTVNACGESQLFDGSFAPGSDDGGGSGSGVEITSFSNENCGRVIRGRVRYEDKTFGPKGFSATTWRPARHVTVEVHRKEDNGLLATGSTDRFGNYEIQFSNQGEPGIYIVVNSLTDFAEGLHPIAVMDHPKFQKLYSVASLSVNEEEVEVPEILFDIPEIVGAGAFNILDVLIDGYDGVRLSTGKDLGQLQVFWATGADTTDTLYCSEYLYEQGICSSKGALSVQGKDTDRDEYDDMVILKEFFKLILDRVSKDSHPGDVHHWTRDLPTRAWTEGVATFFAGDVLERREFVNSRPAGVYLVEDLEAMETPFSFKTASGAMDGPVSGFLVAAVLRDLADAGTDEPFDTLQSGRVGIYDAIFNYFPSDGFADRGVEGIDLVDLLDGWFCRGWDQAPAVEAIVNDHRQFPYVPGGPESCIH